MPTGVVLGYGQKSDGSINEQTINRCDKAVQLFREGKLNWIYLTVSAEKNHRCMAHMMREYMILRGVPEAIIIVDRRGGNTAGEMDVAIDQRGPFDFGLDKFIFVSTWYHIPRIIWLALWRLPLRQFSVAIAWKHAHWKADVLKEFLKFANAILRPKRSAKILQQPL